MYNAKVFRIMTGAPSDITEEINIVKKCIYDWNCNYSEANSTVLLPTHWSTNSFPATGDRPQEFINRQVTDKSDMLICIFGCRLGTPTGKFDSGSIEEIEEHIINKKPVMIYFSVISGNEQIDNDQINKLEAFKKSNKERVLFAEYTSIADFGKQFNTHLQQAVNWYFLSKSNQNINSSLLWADFNASDIIELTKFDIERLTTWTNSNQNDAHIILLSDNKAIYQIGKQYEAKNGKEIAEWSDFFERLVQLKFIDKGHNNGTETFALKKAAYDYINSP